MNPMDPASAFNVFEAGPWGTFASLTAVFGGRAGGMTPKLRTLLSASLIAFGIPDLIECSTGAWWRPPELLVYKRVSLLGILGSYLVMRRNQRPAAFEAFGVVALAFYVASILSLSDKASFGPMLVHGHNWLGEKLCPPGSLRTVPRRVIVYPALSLWLTSPQLAFALVGGFFMHLTAPSRGTSPSGRECGQG